MAARPTWKGFLKVSLVTIPVRVYPATESAATISFNQLHDECQTRIQQKKWCPNCEREVTSAEIVKGYEFEKGRWVVVGDEDIAKVIAQGENVDMTPSHWEVVNFLRDYYNEYQIAPAVRVLTKAIGKQLGPDKGNSKYLYELFPYGPAKQACKIAGLPKPTGCV